MTRRLSLTSSAAVILAATCVLVGTPRGGATTGPGYQFVIGVRLTNTGVAFTRQQHVPRGSVVQFFVSNLSRQQRWFVIGGRKTKLLSPKQREVFYLGFDRRGAFEYRSWGPAAKAFRGRFVVT